MFALSFSGFDPERNWTQQAFLLSATASLLLSSAPRVGKREIDRLRRRDFIALAGCAVAVPVGARAQQQAAKIYRIGYFGSGTANPRLQEIFQKGLSDLGWIEGQNYRIDYRFAEGQYDALPGLADELVRLRVDVIVATPTPACPYRDYVDAGGLMAYTVDLAELLRRMADDVHKILYGAKPGDIPIYQATKFQLLINLKTAKALSLTLPPALLARADEMIE